MSVQHGHGYAFSPSGQLHRVKIKFVGNITTARTECGIIVDTKTWTRVVRGDGHTITESIRSSARCSKCFA